MGEENSPVETVDGRSLARQAHALEGLVTKKLRPTRRLEMAHLFHGTFPVSGALAFRLARFGWVSWYRTHACRGSSDGVAIALDQIVQADSGAVLGRIKQARGFRQVCCAESRM